MTRKQFDDFCERKLWKQVSRYMPWTEKKLDKHVDKIDWNELSRNEEMQWTESILSKYSNRLNWEELSENDAPSLECASIVKPFADKWNWERKIHRVNWTIELIKDIKDFIDWDDMLNCDDTDRAEWLFKHFEEDILNAITVDSYFFDMYAERNWRNLMNKINDEEV